MEWIANGLLIAFGILSVMLFGTILSRGKVILVEPRRWVLLLELILAFSILAIGVERLISYLLS